MVRLARRGRGREEGGGRGVTEAVVVVRCREGCAPVVADRCAARVTAGGDVHLPYRMMFTDRIQMHSQRAQLSSLPSTQTATPYRGARG